MYLRSIRLRNTGPIQTFDLDMPFAGEYPRPLILVGKNGSGKSTVVSFIVNALIGLRQQVYEDVEVDKGRVYRVRSPLAINGSANFYFARVDFDKGVSQVEWQFDRTKDKYGDEAAQLQAVDQSWNQIPATEANHYQLNLGAVQAHHLLEDMLGNTGMLFFPADRFEPPDWLNTESLSSELKLPDPPRIKGRTQRRILARNRLKPTMEWFNSVIFDMMVTEHRAFKIPVGGENGKLLDALLPMPGRGHAVYHAVVNVLKQVLCEKDSDTLELGIGDRNTRLITATIGRNGRVLRQIKDLMSLSAGESALFCMFASIIRDADLSSMQFQSTEDISGIVVIDEADLHLHVELQYKVLPNLIALFPKVQFILSVHAPMVVLGLEKALEARNGFEVREMPQGTQICAETYSEFQTAFRMFSDTRQFQEQLRLNIEESKFPAILVEGKTDATILSTAWGKLYENEPLPYEIIPCGIEPNANERTGGAETLRRCVEYLSIVSDRPIIAVFDNDKAGNEQFGGVNAKAFSKGDSADHKTHKAKPIHAILLPTPKARENFTASPRSTNRYLAIEHYFSDVVLKNAGFTLDPVLPGTDVFEIDAKNPVKVGFADAVASLGAEEFVNFVILFDHLKQIAANFVIETDKRAA